VPAQCAARAGEGLCGTRTSRPGNRVRVRVSKCYEHERRISVRCVSCDRGRPIRPRRPSPWRFPEWPVTAPATGPTSSIHAVFELVAGPRAQPAIRAPARGTPSGRPAGGKVLHQLAVQRAGPGPRRCSLRSRSWMSAAPRTSRSSATAWIRLRKKEEALAAPRTGRRRTATAADTPSCRCQVPRAAAAGLPRPCGRLASEQSDPRHDRPAPSRNSTIAFAHAR